MCIYIFNSQNNLMKYLLRIRKHFSDEETGKSFTHHTAKGNWDWASGQSDYRGVFCICLPARCLHIRTCVHF